ncbi:putative ABC transporter permease [Hugonella massiliensis]|uniref:putative ABC transporter permease n=1 Tax=Hugonella massiliensis TaxID=1720315 RepID=UPI00073E713D|nr:putative ABC transporter permease [Hugonella massiliensis]
MTLSSFVVLFALCSFAGWVYESIHSVIRTGKWDRRGFLYGPICPIYGVGVVGITLIVKAITDMVGTPLAWWQVFLVSFFGSMLLEYPTSYFLEKWFHAYWWDYSNVPLNVNGRISVPTAAVFGAGGLLAIYGIYPLWLQLEAAVPAIAIEIAAYAIVVLITVDATLTVSALTDFQKIVANADRDFNERAGEIAAQVTGGQTAVSAAMDKLEKNAAEAGEALENRRDTFLRTHVQPRIDEMNAAQVRALRRVHGFTDARRSDMRDRVAELVRARAKRKK